MLAQTGRLAGSYQNISPRAPAPLLGCASAAAPIAMRCRPTHMVALFVVLMLVLFARIYQVATEVKGGHTTMSAGELHAQLHGERRPRGDQNGRIAGNMHG